ncbi:MAG TPA: hypothetical protein VJ953_07315 [Saprospiraceae bacterium]|nr:hypothetical protein [Saprospiraceae bacterium]
MKNLDLRKYWLVDRFLDTGRAEQCFYYLLKHYDKTQRYYHNLDHLRSLLVQWEHYRVHLHKPSLLLWAIFYHDVIYEVDRKDNERASAAYAQQDFQHTTLSAADQSEIGAMIVATEQHLPPQNATLDLCYFLDFDLQILGAEREAYWAYAQNIRKEYRNYPDEVYYPGRKQVLERLLAKEYLYQTEIFRERYEEKARENILEEMGRLGDV